MDIIDVYKSTFSFNATSVFKWSPSDNTVHYDEASVSSGFGHLSLLHEISHGLLKHKDFNYDIDLVKHEREAWAKTSELAGRHSISFDRDYADSCLETYRTWLYNRSTCPNCYQTSVETEPQHYRCFNCFTMWHVSKDQSCQIQRRRVN